MLRLLLKAMFVLFAVTAVLADEPRGHVVVQLADSSERCELVYRSERRDGGATSPQEVCHVTDGDGPFEFDRQAWFHAVLPSSRWLGVFAFRVFGWGVLSPAIIHITNYSKILCALLRIVIKCQVLRLKK